MTGETHERTEFPDLLARTVMERRAVRAIRH